MTPVQTAKRIGKGTRNPQNWVQLMQFGLVGASGYVVNLAVFAVLTQLVGLHHIPGAVGAGRSAGLRGARDRERPRRCERPRGGRLRP